MIRKLWWRLEYTYAYASEFPCRACNIRMGWNLSKEALEDWGFASDPVEACVMDIQEDRINDSI